MAWLSTADGDVFRRLESDGFDFSVAHCVDFNIDFDVWPPPDRVLEQIKNQLPDAVVTVDGGGEVKELLVCIFAVLTYESVLRVQAEPSEISAPFSGRCESWGVLH